MPAQYATLMEHCWATQPEERPTAEQLLEALQYLMQQLPEDAALAAGQQQQQQPDGLRRVQSMPPVLFTRPPRKQQQRLTAQQSFLAATAGVFDMREQCDTLVPDAEQQGRDCAAAGGGDAAAAASSEASVADQLNRSRSEPAKAQWDYGDLDEGGAGFQGVRDAVV
jgi:hypothetical protein